MKQTLRILTLVGLAASGLSVWAQATTPGTEPNTASVAASTPAAAAVVAEAPKEAAPAGEVASAPAAAPAEATGAPAAASTEVASAPAAAPADTAAAAAPATPAPEAPAAPAAAIEVASAPVSAAADATAAAAPATPAGEAPAAEPAPAEEMSATPPASAPSPQAGGIIPLIVMDDVPLTDAIKNLARQAGLNYMLDPRVVFGQPGPDGKIVPQPNVSIRWENVTAAQALGALLGNYNLELVEDPKSKIARITVKDPAAPDPLVTRVIQLKYCSPSNIVDAVKNAVTDKRSKVVPDVRTSQLVVLATEKELADIEPLIERLDTPTKQVLIEARLLEASTTPSTKKGVDWSGTLQAQTLSFGNNLQTKPVESKESANPPLATEWPKLMLDTAKGLNPSTAFLDADGVSAVVSFLNTYADAKVISTPRTVTLDNEPAKIEVFRASPIINVTPGTVQTAGGSEITYTNLGVLLNVTPRISANNYVNLKVIPEVSRLGAPVNKIVNGALFQVDSYDIRKLETRVMIPSGNTLVLGGLIQDDVRTDDTKVPGLGDLPVLGGLFRSNGKARNKSNLIVFLTPTIVADEDFQPTKSEYLKSPVPLQDTVEGDWSSWDSGQPKDWSKKKGEGEQASAK